MARPPRAAKPQSRASAGLASLTELRSAIAAQAQARAEAQARQRAQQLADELRRTEFRRAIGDVTPLPPSDRVNAPPPAPEPLARQRDLDDRAALDASLSDEIDIETLLDTDDGLSYCAQGIGPDVLRRLRRGHWKIQGQLDLHGHRVDEARVCLIEFLRDAGKRGQRCVRIVHGKGLGSANREPVLKGRVRKWLVQREEVIAFCQARAAEGGSGALVVLLRAAVTRNGAA